MKKTKQVPIQLPSIARTLFDAKKIIKKKFFPWTLEIIQFIRFENHMDGTRYLKFFLGYAIKYLRSQQCWEVELELARLFFIHIQFRTMCIGKLVRAQLQHKQSCCPSVLTALLQLQLWWLLQSQYCYPSIALRQPTVWTGNIVRFLGITLSQHRQNRSKVPDVSCVSVLHVLG